MPRKRGLLGRIWSAVQDLFGEKGSPAASLRSSAEQMLEGLDLVAEATSFAMTRADEVQDKLRAEIENYESLGREAESFVRDGDQQAAMRCITLQVQSGETVARLKEQYISLQREADQKVADLQRKKQDVEQRVAALPELEQEQRLVHLEERIARATSQLSLESPQNAFDQAAREIRIRRNQLRNKELLTADPNAELDARIREAVGQRKIDAAWARLLQKVGEPNRAIR